MSMSSLVRHIAAAGMVVVLAGCGSKVALDEPGQPLVSVLRAEEVAAIEEPGECDDTGACSMGFGVGGVGFSLSCGAVRPEAVSDDVIAAGVLRGEEVELRRILDVDPDVLLAISIEGGQCAEGEPVLSPWSMAFAQTGAEDGPLREAICAAAVEEHLERNSCP